MIAYLTSLVQVVNVEIKKVTLVALKQDIWIKRGKR